MDLLLFAALPLWEKFVRINQFGRRDLIGDVASSAVKEKNLPNAARGCLRNQRMLLQLKKALENREPKTQPACFYG
jgi:hypothetical protein